MKEIQEFNRRKILCAVHNTEDYREATLLDLGCSPKVAKEEALREGDKYKISSPILSRVLLALGGGMEAKTTIDSSPDKIPCLWIFNGQFLLLWDLTKETLEEQSEKCQISIFNLLGGK